MPWRGWNLQLVSEPAQLHEKGTVISKLNETIHSLRDNVNAAKVKNDIDETETINIELEHIVICSSDTSGSKPTCNTKNNRISQPSSSNKTNKVQDQSRSVKSRKNKKNRVVKTECNAYVMQSMLNANSKSLCVICNECLFNANHNKCVLDYVHDVNVLSKSKSAKRRTFTIVRNKCPLTRFISTKVVPLKETTIKSVFTPTQGIKVYSRRPKAIKYLGSSSKSKITESRISNNLEPAQAGESNVPSSSLIYCRSGNVTISRVYYIERLGHNLFSVGQLCDSNLEVAFHKHTCCVRNLEGVDLLTGSRGTNLYTLSIGDMMKSSPICLLSKASKTKSWLWHRRLSHLNFGTINQLAKQGLVRGLPKLKFENDHLCSACSLGKSKKQSHKPKSEDTNQEKLYLLHMDLCRPMRIESINGKKYILVIVDDYSRITWVKFLRSKDEAPEFIIKFLKMIQVRLNASVRNIRTDNVEAARTMLIYAKALLFPWDEAFAIACYTHNRSLIRLRHKKTPYELLDNRKPDLSYLHVFCALCYPTNDSEDLGKLKAKADVDFDELTAMASGQSSSRPALNEMTPGTLSSGLVPKHPSSTPFVPPTRNDWDTLLQPLFDEYLCPSPNVDHPVPEALASVPVVSTNSPSSTLVDQDVPSPSTSQTPQELPSQVIPPDVEEADHDIKVGHMDNNPSIGFPIS
ncbi:integrase, catalytic region, zinc finger, CCHC-type containing protein [Tanacetum coccineum]